MYIVFYIILEISLLMLDQSRDQNNTMIYHGNYMVNCQYDSYFMEIHSTKNIF